jgi:hypothetical protein
VSDRGRPRRGARGPAVSATPAGSSSESVAARLKVGLGRPGISDSARPPSDSGPGVGRPSLPLRLAVRAVRDSDTARPTYSEARPGSDSASGRGGRSWRAGRPQALPGRRGRRSGPGPPSLTRRTYVLWHGLVPHACIEKKCFDSFFLTCVLLGPNSAICFRKAQIFLSSNPSVSWLKIHR